MNKILCKAFMNQSRLRNKYLKNPNILNKRNYKKQRNYSLNLLKREKKKYYGNLDLRKITDNKKFWSTIKPLFSEKSKSNRKITLVEGEYIISSEIGVAETMKDFFSNVVKKLEIKGYENELCNDTSVDKISNAMNFVMIHL